jgi:hypothetical protein
VSGNDVSRIFRIDNATAALKPVTLTDGWTSGAGGAISSSEPPALKNVVIRSS